MAIGTKQVASAAAKEKYTKSKAAFFKKGVITALISGILYGLYSAFIVAGEGVGNWPAFWELGIGASILGYCLLCAIGAGLNDFCSAVWQIVIAIVKGKFGDFIATLKTKPGVIMIGVALAGGPIAATAYNIGLMMAGGIAAAISALCAAVGAIIGHFFLKQALNFRKVCGIIICFGAAVVIGWTSFDGLDMSAFIGCCIAFIAAVGWGIEGSIGGFATSMIDDDISITIRQCTSGLTNLIIVVPILCVMARAMLNTSDIPGNIYVYLIGGAVAGGAIIWFIFSGLFCGQSFRMWYKGTSMCGAALGMTLNAMYSFWVPLCSWLLMGVIIQWDYPALTATQWVMAFVEVFGILLIAMNPLDLFRRKKEA